MGFTTTEEAKPLVSQKHGLPCLGPGCGATKASLWRGPGGRYCAKSQCRKAGRAAARLRAAGRFEDGSDADSAPTARRDDDHSDQIAELTSEIKELRSVVEQLVKHVTAERAGTKRLALTDVSNGQPPSATVGPAKVTSSEKARRAAAAAAAATTTTLVRKNGHELAPGRPSVTAPSNQAAEDAAVDGKIVFRDFAGVERPGRISRWDSSHGAWEIKYNMPGDPYATIHKRMPKGALVEWREGVPAGFE